MQQRKQECEMLPCHCHRTINSRPIMSYIVLRPTKKRLSGSQKGIPRVVRLLLAVPRWYEIRKYLQLLGRHRAENEGNDGCTISVSHVHKVHWGRCHAGGPALKPFQFRRVLLRGPNSLDERLRERIFLPRLKLQIF